MNLQTRIKNITTNILSSKNSIRNVLIEKGVSSSLIPTNPTFNQIISAIRSIDVKILLFVSNILNYQLTISPSSSIDKQVKEDTITIVFLKNNNTFTYTAYCEGYKTISNSITISSTSNQIYIENLFFESSFANINATNIPFNVPKETATYTSNVKGVDYLDNPLLIKRKDDDNNVYLIFCENRAKRLTILKYSTIEKVFSLIFQKSTDSAIFSKSAYSRERDKIFIFNDAKSSSRNLKVLNYPYTTLTDLAYTYNNGLLECSNFTRNDQLKIYDPGSSNIGSIYNILTNTYSYTNKKPELVYGTSVIDNWKEYYLGGSRAIKSNFVFNNKLYRANKVNVTTIESIYIELVNENTDTTSLYFKFPENSVLKDYCKIIFTGLYSSMLNEEGNNLLPLFGYYVKPNGNDTSSAVTNIFADNILSFPINFDLETNQVSNFTGFCTLGEYGDGIILHKKRIYIQFESIGGTSISLAQLKAYQTNF